MTGQRNSLSAFNHRIQLVSNRHRLFIRPLPTSLQEKDAFNMSTNSASPKETQTAPKSSSAKPSPRLCMSYVLCAYLAQAIFPSQFRAIFLAIHRGRTLLSAELTAFLDGFSLQMWRPSHALHLSQMQLYLLQ